MTKKRKGRLGTRETLLGKHHVRRQKSGFARRKPSHARAEREGEAEVLRPDQRASDDWRPGDRVVMRGRALYSMGCIASELAARVWTVVACRCDLCALGRHVRVDDGRHIARAALRGETQLCVDELRACDSDAFSAAIGAGIARAARRG